MLPAATHSLTQGRKTASRMNANDHLGGFMHYTRLTPVLAALALSACASTPSVYTDFSPTVSFSNFHSYGWVKEPTDVPPLVSQRIVADINAQLQAKGWRLEPSAANADVALAAHVSTQQKQTLDTFYDGPTWAGWGWQPGWYAPGWYAPDVNMATTTVYTYEVGTLVVDMFDTKTKQAIWRGSATDTVPQSPQAQDAALKAGIDKMFSGFPPESPKPVRQ